MNPVKNGIICKESYVKMNHASMKKNHVKDK